MKKSASFRTQLFALMALLVFLQSIALVFALSISRVFFMLDAESFRFFDNTTNSRAQSFDASVGALIGDVTSDGQSLNEQLNTLAEQRGIRADEIYLDNDVYAAFTETTTENLLDLLESSTISGAFVVLNGSNTDKLSAQRHSAIYLRNSAPGVRSQDRSNYQLEVGPIAISQQFYLATSINWSLDMQIAETSDFYTQPLYASALDKNAERERYGYWSAPVDVLNDNKSVITYTQPLLDHDGAAYGVIGIEISLTLFNQFYLPNDDLPYSNSFYAVVLMQDDVLDLSWYIPSGPLAQVYLKAGEMLPVSDVRGSDLKQATLDGLGAVYCSSQPLNMYSKNSIYYNESWSLVGFVPQQVLHETSSDVRSTLTSSIVITTLISVFAIFVITFIATRKIVGLSQDIKKMAPFGDISFSKTGLREIDELTSAVEMFNRSAINASKTVSKILELTLLPIGGFEVSSELKHVALTEYIYKLLQLPPSAQLSQGQWEEFYRRLKQKPSDAYDNVYRYRDAAENTLWLRILENTTDTGYVGVVLDVTRDIEEHRRLANELDYDSLTHLYNRTAFKREAFKLIQDQPDKIGVMIFADLDNLKYINDTYGHDMGDRLIMRAGDMFREFERYGGIVSRISGDEFAIYVHGFDNKETARNVIYDQFKRNGQYVLDMSADAFQKIRSSAGIAWYPGDSDNVTDLLKLSDFSMYEAKHNEKGSIFEFNRDSYQQNVYLLDNREAISRLLDESLIHFAFQPIINLHSGEIYAYEALMRPLLENFRSPLEILNVAAAQSKLGQLERIVFMTAMQYLQDHEAQFKDAKLFLNSIPSQTLSQEDNLIINERFSDLFDRIVVEITEAESNSPSQMSNKLDFIHSSGMKLAIDDFGSGYSNEIRILSFEPDIVKIDMALIRDIDTNIDKQQLVENLVTFCHPKGIRLVAEGVETVEELAEIIRLNVDFVQGYYTGRPHLELRPISAEIRAKIQELQSLQP